MRSPKRGERLHRVERMPGMSHALKAISDYSYLGNGCDMKEYAGDKGKEIRRKGVRKIAELWQLSESAEKALQKEWVDGEAKPLFVWEGDDHPYIFFREEAEEMGLCETSERDVTDDKDNRGKDGSDDEDNLSVKIVVAEEERDIGRWQQICKELDKNGATVLTSNMVEKKHIYLDVTDIDYNVFCRSYKSVRLLRSRLGINKKDIRKGRPESVSDDTALLVDYLYRHGATGKAIARHLPKFKPYSRDNPRGPYPLLHKYKKVGGELSGKLSELEDYLQEITGLKGENLFRS